MYVGMYTVYKVRIPLLYNTACSVHQCNYDSSILAVQLCDVSIRSKLILPHTHAQVVM